MAIVGQTTTLNCGAACLLCAAIELNRNPILGNAPVGSKIEALGQAGVPFGISNAWLDAIYDISGAGQAGYSLPSGIIAAARLLGMTPTVIMANTNTVNFLQRQYPHEIAACRNETERRDSANLGDLTLGAGERAMHCVRIGMTPAVHWVLQRDDNTYMDPAGGATPLNITQGGGDRTGRANMKATGQSVDVSMCCISTTLTVTYHGTGLAIKLV